MKHLFLFLTVLLLPVTSNATMYTNPKNLVLQGLNDYDRHDLKKVIATWGIDSSVEVIKQIRAKEKTGGKFREYKVLGSITVDSKNEVYYAALYYEYTCCYLEVKLYDSIRRWVVVSVTMVDAETYLEKINGERMFASLEEINLRLKTIDDKVADIETGMKRIDSELSGIKSSIDGLKVETKK